jgi:endonuclease III
MHASSKNNRRDECGSYKSAMEVSAVQSNEKIPFNISRALKVIERATATYPKAALFELAEAGYDSAFEQLVACVISIRTLDETTLIVSQRLFERVRTPQAIAQLEISELANLLKPATFYRQKAVTISNIARITAGLYGGKLPCSPEKLLALPGVGPKCANLVLGIACGQSFIGVDIHVHRVTNRWGYVRASTPEKTMGELEKKLPRRFRVEINRLLVPFGKHICTGSRPKCSTCPVLKMCRQVGVTSHR